MLGRKDYSPDEVATAKAAVATQVAAYRTLAHAVDAAPSDAGVSSALEELEPVLFTNMVLALDRFFVHRVRMVAGKDGNPLNEVELLAESIIGNEGVLESLSPIRYVPAESTLGLEVGDRIRLSADQFERLADAFFAELERRFV
ncbi:hypothetical protein N865_06015 [Intrasporangium oryzae NRRL B-24470]|uniref:Uncharacterized protein n=1 Tax=Intrasporangium oryzae NRRL B-24470 TaxID=1386089 RepID=W9GEM6_9MICO|nr:hypothetical protein [Intrasporangium oryzae]EWT02334.1 hypothetical protein N865_06015 [Intrasporangium oryzae NRRL B-24470]